MCPARPMRAPAASNTAYSPTNYEPKSRSRRAGDQFDEKIVIVRGAPDSIVQVPTTSFANWAGALFTENANPNAAITDKLTILHRFMMSLPTVGARVNAAKRLLTDSHKPPLKLRDLGMSSLAALLKGYTTLPCVWKGLIGIGYAKAAGPPYRDIVRKPFSSRPAMKALITAMAVAPLAILDAAAAHPFGPPCRLIPQSGRGHIQPLSKV